MIGVAEGHWKPATSVHGAGLSDALRVTFTLWYAVGRLLGLFADRLDLVVSFVTHPLPYVATGRLLVAAAAIATMGLVARLGRTLADPAAGLAGAVLLAVSFIHVRESHHVWPDVPAAALVVATIAVALAALRRPGIRAALALGLVAGAALATKHSTFPVAVPALLAVWATPERRTGARVRRLAVFAAIAVATYIVLSPYTVLEFRETYRMTLVQGRATFQPSTHDLSLPRLVSLGIGWPVAALAVLGLGFSLVPRPRLAAPVVAAFPLTYLIVLLMAGRLFARYLALLAPFTALYAGVAAIAIGRRLLPRRPGLATAAVVLAVGGAGALQTLRYEAFLAREDTRWLAGAWIAEHVPAGSVVTLPNLMWYANPVLPPDPDHVRVALGGNVATRLAPRMAGAWSPYTTEYLAILLQPTAGWRPRGFVVTADHPVVLPQVAPSPAVLAALRAADARPVAIFEGTPAPLPRGVVYDPLEAEFVPLSGSELLRRPGPNLTIWAVPPR